MRALHNIFGVSGNPILHSKSPDIFSYMFNEYGLFDSFYIRIASDTSEEAIEVMKNLGMQGLNITAPFKTDIIQYLDEIDEHSKKINAVNVIINKNDKLKGYNTDYIGVTESLKTELPDLSNQKCLVIGAGGAGRAAAYGMLKEKAAVTLINRSNDAAEKTALSLGCKFVRWDDLENVIKKEQIIVNTIPNIEFDIRNYLTTNHILLNADYSSEITEMQCKVISGKQWLINQALAAFQIFTGLTPGFNKNIFMEKISSGKGIKQKKNIFLIGFIGSGKTAIGKQLAEKLNWKFVDTDELIIEKEGIPISEIFKQKGEPYFREIESEILQSLKNESHTVIAGGGGMVIEEENRIMMIERSNVFWIYSPVDVCIKRLDNGLRPPLSNPFENISDPQERGEILFNFRIPYYCEIADMLIYNNSTVEKAVKKIYDEINSCFKY